jgi:hypothetical protein
MRMASKLDNLVLANDFIGDSIIVGALEVC